MYYDDKKGEFEIENIIEINKNVADENSFEINEYYADKIEKYYRNCNLIFELENKFHQYLRNCKISNNIRRIIKIKIKSTIIVPGKNIFILKFIRKFKFNLENYFRIVMELPCGAALVDHMTYVAHTHIIKTFPLRNL
jgi:hypothetical protein